MQYKVGDIVVFTKHKHLVSEYWGHTAEVVKVQGEYALTLKYRILGTNEYFFSKETGSDFNRFEPATKLHKALL